MDIDRRKVMESIQSTEDVEKGSMRVLGDNDTAAMYDGTTGMTFGPVYREARGDAVRELKQYFDWLPAAPQTYSPRDQSTLMTAFKVDQGWWERRDWERQVEDAESLLGREI